MKIIESNNLTDISGGCNPVGASTVAVLAVVTLNPFVMAAALAWTAYNVATC